MATKTTKAKTVAERREELERQLENIRVYELIEELLNGFKTSCQNEIDGALTTSDYKGKQTEQATNSDGDLLYEIDAPKMWGRYTEAQLKEHDRTPESEDVNPYYRDIWEERTMTPEELKEFSTYSYNRYEAGKKLLETLEKIDIFSL